MNCIQSFFSTLFDRSLLNYSNERILKERLERGPLPLHEKIVQASKRACSEFPKTIVINAIIRNVLHLFESQSTLSLPKDDRQINFFDISAFDFVVVHPICEELIFRIGVLGAVHFLQDCLQAQAPRNWKGKTVDWLTSDYARVVAVQAIFAAVHLRANYQSTFNAAVQALGIFLAGNSCTIEYETTNSLVASTAFHITNNAIVRGLLALGAK